MPQEALLSDLIQTITPPQKVLQSSGFAAIHTLSSIPQTHSNFSNSFILPSSYQVVLIEVNQADMIPPTRYGARLLIGYSSFSP